MRLLCAVASLVLLPAPLLRAELVRIEVLDRTDVRDGAAFGPAGPYERIAGRASFALDPEAPANRIIAGLDRAPRNEHGLVEFSADIVVLKPRDTRLGNGTILFDVVNRGNATVPRTFSRPGAEFPPDLAGDGFLLEQGYTLVWLGWQYDLADRPGLIRLDAPAARGLSGTVRRRFIPDGPQTQLPLREGNMTFQPVTAGAAARARLTVRDHGEPRGREVPRSQWRLKDGVLTGTFAAGRIYEFEYPAQDPGVAGIGAAGIRDLISYLKYSGRANTYFVAERRFLKRAIAFGVSQSGRYLRTFVYDGFNADEKGRRVFDGVIAHVAGAARGSFNEPFAQPSRTWEVEAPPFHDLELLAAARRAGAEPKMFHTLSSTEYYQRAASLLHTSADGRRDLPPPPGSRIYHFSGTQHGPAGFPPGEPRGMQQRQNPNDYRWCLRALLTAMNRWLGEGTEPPPSSYPTLAEGGLTPLAGLKWKGAPARMVTPSPAVPLAPQVDAGGNEIGGIRLPEIAEPLATYTGWNLRSPAAGAPREMASLAGSWIPFARTAAERKARQDPRLSIAERYAGREDYLGKVQAAARKLASDGYVLEADVPALVELAAKRWDVR